MVYHSQDLSHDQQPGGANELTNSALEAPVEQAAPATPPSAATAGADAPDTTPHADTNATVAIVAPATAAASRSHGITVDVSPVIRFCSMMQR